MNLFAPWHSVGIAQTLKKLKTSPKGLYQREAARRFQQFGPNCIHVGRPIPPLWRIVARQWRNPFLIAVGIIAVIAFVSGSVALAATFGILFVLYTTMGVAVDERQITVGEFLRSIAHSLSLIKRLLTSKSVAVSQLRPIEEVVPGDIVILATGDTVPADGRVLQSVDLEVDESMLTGESAPQEKHIKTLPAATSLLSRTNMVFSQSMVTRGNAVVAITATGTQTVVGSIGRQQHDVVKPTSPLSQDLRRFYWSVVIVATLFTALLFIMGRSRGWGMSELFPLAVMMSIAVVPQWLLSAVTLSFAEAARRLAGMGTMIKRPSSTDTIGRVTTLCIDKTSTLTQGSLSVESVITSDGSICSTSGLSLSQSSTDCQELWRAIICCNDARESTASIRRGNQRVMFVGDSTDCAIAGTGKRLGIDRQWQEKKFPRIRMFSFTTTTKWMATIHIERGKNPTFRLYAKGAPERVVDLCSWRWSGATHKRMRSADRAQILHYIQRYSEQGYRVLGVARARYASRSRVPATSAEVEHLAWLGLVLLADPIRPEARLCVDELARLGLRILLITGDHPVTAAMVAMALGLPSGRTVVGSDVEQMNDGQLAAAVAEHGVFARIEPRGKERIVKVLQQQGHVVAMTGDGINDAFALKHSDIGIAVANATDVAREAADIVVTSENLFSIHAVLKEGRRVVACIQTMVGFSLVTLSAMATVLFGSLLLFTPSIMRPLHVVWLTIVVYLIPLLSLLSDHSLPYRFSSRSIRNGRRCAAAVAIGVLLGGAALSLPLVQIPPSVSIVAVRTDIWMALSIMPLGLLVGGISGRWQHSDARSHMIVIGSLLLAIGLQLLTITDPWMRVAFEVEGISLLSVLVIVGGFLVMAVMRMLLEHQEQKQLIL